jgi:hypothetical protein
MWLSSSLAFFTRSRTRPRLDFASKMTTRMTRLPTSWMWMFAFSPSWNCVANSFSLRSFAMPPVAAMLPAVSEASEVVSRLSTSPLAAMSWPFLSTMKTTLAFAS